MSRRYAEFRQSLVDDYASLEASESLAQTLRAEIHLGNLLVPRINNLRLSYAEEELQATLDHIEDIKRRMKAAESG